MSLDNPELLDFVRLSRKIKILGCKKLEKDYDLAIYIDADMKFKKPISEFIISECDLKNYDFFAINHTIRNCIYEEAKVCKKLKLDKDKIINEEINFLKKEKFPKNYGLTANGFFARKTNNKFVDKILKDW